MGGPDTPGGNNGEAPPPPRNPNAQRALQERTDLPPVAMDVTPPVAKAAETRDSALAMAEEMNRDTKDAIESAVRAASDPSGLYRPGKIDVTTAAQDKALVDAVAKLKPNTVVPQEIGLVATAPPKFVVEESLGIQDIDLHTLAQMAPKSAEYAPALVADVAPAAAPDVVDEKLAARQRKLFEKASINTDALPGIGLNLKDVGTKEWTDKVKELQVSFGLTGSAVDGLFGGQTMGAMYEAIAKAPTKFPDSFREAAADVDMNLSKAKRTALYSKRFIEKEGAM